MAHTYSVAGGEGSAPGALGPDELDGRAEWVPASRGRDLLSTLGARLGSEVDLRKVVLGVVCPLRASLEGPPLETLLAALPAALAREVREGELNLNARLRSPASAGEYLLDVSRLLLQTPRRAAVTVRALFGAVRATLGPDALEAMVARLPRDVADLVREAR
jgi:uncharacterized protein (DUF2267 family)